MIAEQAKRPGTARKRPAAKPGPRFISAHELYPLAELKRRLGWGEHAVRQARRAGLRLSVFGREKYVLGEDVLAFFRRLAEGKGREHQ